MKENAIRQSSRTYKPYNRNFEEHKTPGRKVGIIVVADHVIYLTVNQYRTDYKKVVSQAKFQKIAKLPKYEESLFDSCFKNWS
jgi:hypothetical protein